MIHTFIGGFFGDEGKGKQTATVAKKISQGRNFKSELASKRISGYGFRYNGGPNGGHALTVGDKRVSGHVLPSTVLYPNILSIVGAGCSVHPSGLVKEIQDFKDAGFFRGPLVIDDKAEIILDLYRVLDGKRSGKRSTGSGIADVYGHKYKRDGIKARDLLDADRLQDKLPALVNSLAYEYLSQEMNESNGENIFKHIEKFTTEYPYNRMIQELLDAGEFLRPFISSDVSDELRQAVLKDLPILNEGSQSYFLGIDSGIEYGSSSCIDPQAIFVTQNIPVVPQKISAIVKAFGSRVGDAYFVGECGNRDNSLRKADLLEKLGFARDAPRVKYEAKAIEMMRSSNDQEIGDGLRLFYNEFGETTGRPRGKAPLDLVALRTLQDRIARGSINDCELWINQADGLEHFDEIPIITAYKDPTGKTYDRIPAWTDDKLRALDAKLEYLPSWDKTLCMPYSEWPKNAKKWLNYISDETGFKIAGIGCGPENGDIVRVNTEI